MPSNSPGRHSANDGSFGRSVASAGGRGLALIVIAVLLGAFLLNETKDPATISAVSPDPGDTTDTTPSDLNGSTDTTPADTSGTGSTIAGDPTQTTQLGTNGTVQVEATPINEIRVLVLNGQSGIGGVAAEVTELLNTTLGYTQTLEPANGPAHTQTTVYFAPNFEGDCQRLAQAVSTARDERLFTSPVTEVLTAEAPTAVNADCVVVIGKPQASTDTTAAI